MAVPVRPTCRHCGSPVADGPAAAAGFCCPGCAYVHRLITEQGHDAYYRIKDSVTAPADSAVFQPRDTAWLAELLAGAEAASRDGTATLELDVQGISCAGCVWLIERVTTQLPGVRSVTVDAPTGSLQVDWRCGAFDAGGWARRLQAFGYLVGPAGIKPERLESTGLARRIGLCAAFALNVMLFTLPAYFGMRADFAFAGLFRLLALTFATLSVLVGGSYFFSRAAAALRAGIAHIDLPIALGIAGAYAGSLYGWLSGHERLLYFDFVATFTLLMLTGRWAQVRAVERNRRRLLRHQPLPPRVRLAGGGAVPRDNLQSGQSIEIDPGQTVPVDGLLEGDTGLFSLASINGEADPRLSRTGSRIPAGAVNVGRAGCRLRTLQAWPESFLARILEAGPRRESRSASMERIVGAYVVGILAASVLTAAGWLLAGRGLVRAGTAAIAVLVVSCPCAIGLAVPLVEEAATSAARGRGVFVREPGLWQRLGSVRKIVFDKTGTLTLESPVLRNPAALEALDAGERAALAALVRDSLHPVSQCLWEALVATAPVEPAAGDVAEFPGLGVRMGPWSLGRAGWSDSGPPGPGTVLARDGVPAACFHFLDAPRPNAGVELHELTRLGYSVFILSGDDPAKVAALAAGVGLSPAHAIGGRTAQEKADWIGQNDRNDTLMLGDGANDSLAFDRAHCRGTPLVHRGILEAKADFYYLRRGVEGVRELLLVNRARRRTQSAVIGFSITYNVLAAGFAAAGTITPLLAAVLMPLSSLASLLIVGAGTRPMMAPRPPLSQSAPPPPEDGGTTAPLSAAPAESAIL